MASFDFIYHSPVSCLKGGQHYPLTKQLFTGRFKTEVSLLLIQWIVISPLDSTSHGQPLTN